MVDYSRDIHNFVLTTVDAPWLAFPLDQLHAMGIRITRQQAKLRKHIFEYIYNAVKNGDAVLSDVSSATVLSHIEQAEETLATLGEHFVNLMAEHQDKRFFGGVLNAAVRRRFDEILAVVVTALSRSASDGVPFHLLRPERAAVMFMRAARHALHARGLVEKYSKGRVKGSGWTVVTRVADFAAFIGMLASRGLALRIRIDNAELLQAGHKAGGKRGLQWTRNIAKPMADRLQYGFGTMYVMYYEQVLYHALSNMWMLQKDDYPLTWAALNTTGAIPQRADLPYDIQKVLGLDVSDAGVVGDINRKARGRMMMYDRRLSFGVRQITVENKEGVVLHNGDNIVWVDAEGREHARYDPPMLDVIERVRAMAGMPSLEVEPDMLLFPASREAVRLHDVDGLAGPRDIAVTPASPVSPVSPVSQPEPRDSTVTSDKPDPLPPETRRIIRELEEGCRDRVEQVENGAGPAEWHEPWVERVEQVENGAGEAFDETVPAVGVRIGAVEDWRYSDATYRIRGMTREKLLANIRPFSELVERGRAGVAAL